MAYGISTEPRDAVSNPLSADQQFKSLDPTLSPRPPVGADFRAAFESLLGQLFAHQYPAHPEFETEINIRVEGGNAPDLAIIPQPGLLQRVVGTGEVLAAPESWGVVCSDVSWNFFGNNERRALDSSVISAHINRFTN